MTNPYNNLFLIDNDREDRQFFKKALLETRIQATLRLYRHGPKLPRMIGFKAGKASLIFLDIYRPPRDGKQTLVQIRARKNLNSVPIIILSSSSYMEDIDFTFENGANLFLQKPTTSGEYVSILEEIISSGSLFSKRTARETFIFQKIAKPELRE